MEQTQLRPFVFLHLVSSNISLEYVVFQRAENVGVAFQFRFEANNCRMGCL